MSGDAGDARHRPVMLAEVLAALAPCNGETIVDCTFGAGGYTRAILDSAACRVIALDRDPDAIREGAGLAAQFAGRLTLVKAMFGDIEAALHALPLPALGDGGATVSENRLRACVDGVVLDIGVSSMQLDQAERGFSFQSDGPLDMRMSRVGRSAADFVNEADEVEISDILFRYGEERQSRRIARAIVADRAKAPFISTRQLAGLVERLLGRSRDDKKHPATRTFQALRIAINDELGELQRGLAAAERLLRPGGRLVVVTFHSEEDRIVKRFLAERAGRAPAGSRHLPARAVALQPGFRIVNPRPLTPSSEEIAANPRARSAKLRAAVRTDAPPPSPSLARAPGD
jgi:16S rRNA (cytosine1402-N4)-methyltransferase